jgi:hypothetical protein
MTATAELTDARLDAIIRAREVLTRACSEHAAARGSAKLSRVTAAMACLQDAIRTLDSDMASHWSVRVIAVIRDVMGPEAATYVAGDEGELWH